MKYKETKENNYYSFTDIILSLREAYQEVNDILQCMHFYIQVDSKYPVEAKLSLSLGIDDGRVSIAPKVDLTVSKNRSLAADVRNKMNQFAFSPLRWSKDHASYTLIHDNGVYRFAKSESSVPNDFQANVVIPKEYQEDFAKHFEDLKASTLYQLPSLIIWMNAYQDLCVTGGGILLDSKDDNGKGISIRYDGSRDKIDVHSNIRYSTCFLKDLLDTNIPKCEFPQEYVSLLEGTDQKCSSSYIRGFVGKRHEELELQPQNKTLIYVSKDQDI